MGENIIAPSIEHQRELLAMTRTALIELAKQTPIPGRENDPLFGTVYGILGKRAAKGEYAYHIAEVEANR